MLGVHISSKTGKFGVGTSVFSENTVLVNEWSCSNCAYIQVSGVKCRSLLSFNDC